MQQLSAWICCIFVGQTNLSNIFDHPLSKNARLPIFRSLEGVLLDTPGVNWGLKDWKNAPFTKNEDKKQKILENGEKNGGDIYFSYI